MIPYNHEPRRWKGGIGRNLSHRLSDQPLNLHQSTYIVEPTSSTYAGARKRRTGGTRCVSRQVRAQCHPVDKPLFANPRRVENLLRNFLGNIYVAKAMEARATKWGMHAPP